MEDEARDISDPVQQIDVTDSDGRRWLVTSIQARQAKRSTVLQVVLLVRQREIGWQHRNYHSLNVREQKPWGIFLLRVISDVFHDPLLPTPFRPTLGVIAIGRGGKNNRTHLLRTS
jgi:hypothetical protein